MPETDELQSDWDVATRDVREVPVREKRMARRVRRRRVLVALGLLLALLVLVAVVAGGLLAGKAAIDPGYDPPFFSGAASEIGFADPAVARGHTRLGDYLRSIHRPMRELSGEELRAEGLVLRGRLELLGHSGEILEPGWSLRAIGHRMPLPVTTYPSDAVIRPRSQDETHRVAVWVPIPRQTGRYVVEFKLRSAGGRVLAEARTKPFPVLARDFFTEYRTPAYSARMPRDWALEQDYEDVVGRHVSKAVGPNGLSVLIDTTAKTSGDPARSAKTLHERFVTVPGYRRLKFERAKLGPTEAFEWSYQLGKRRFTDVFFYRGGDGFAVLAEGPSSRFPLVRRIAREVARSVRPTG